MTTLFSKARALTGCALLALVTGLSPGIAQAQSADTPIKIGILAPYSGVFAEFGPKVIEAPIRLYLKEHDNKIGGHPVVLVIADDQSKPSVDVEKAKELVEDQHVNVIIGLVNSAGALAVRDYLDHKKVLTIITVAGAKQLTQDRKSTWIFRVSFANGQMEAAGALLAKTAGINSMSAIGSDYVGGHQLMEPLLKNFQALGGKVVNEAWVPLDTADFSSYLSQMKQAGAADATMPMLFGDDAVRFFTQYTEFGFKAPIFAYGDTTEQTLFLDHVGNQAIGTKVYWDYSPYLDTPENNAFRKDYVAQYKRLPGGFSAQAYSGMQFLDAAVTAAGNGMSDPEAVRQQMEKVSIVAPSGPEHFDKDHGVVFTVYLNEVEKGPDGIVAQMPVGPKVVDVDQYQTLAEAEKNLKK